MSLNVPVHDWHGKTVWMVGASTGIGRATASRLHARGARVIVRLGHWRFSSGTCGKGRYLTEGFLSMDMRQLSDLDIATLWRGHPWALKARRLAASLHAQGRISRRVRSRAAIMLLAYGERRCACPE